MKGRTGKPTSPSGTDHVRAQAPALLEHLNLGHRPELAACLRSHGVDAETAEASALDRHGLTAVGVGPSGVSQVRLSFPAPVTRLEELGAGLCAVLHCQCQRDDQTGPLARSLPMPDIVEELTGQGQSAKDRLLGRRARAERRFCSASWGGLELRASALRREGWRSAR